MELAEFTLIYIGEYLSDLTPYVEQQQQTNATFHIGFATKVFRYHYVTTMCMWSLFQHKRLICRNGIGKIIKNRNVEFDHRSLPS